MGFFSIFGSLIGLFIGFIGLFKKEYSLMFFGFGIFVLGIMVFMHLKKSKKSFKERCNQDIIRLSNNLTKKNQTAINQLKIIRDLK